MANARDEPLLGSTLEVDHRALATRLLLTAASGEWQIEMPLRQPHVYARGVH